MVPATNKGQARLESILNTALNVFTEDGYSHFTTRNVARRLGISVGNLHYYFPNKAVLLKAMFENVVESYKPVFTRVMERAGDDPRDRFVALIRYLICDLGSEATTSFFPELWALANHDPMVAGLMEEMYDWERQQIHGLVAAIRPDVDDARHQEITLFISASIEGLTMFIGHRKSHARLRDTMVATALNCYQVLLGVEITGDDGYRCRRSRRQSLPAAAQPADLPPPRQAE
jgi:AcrR family transcriptional regulator